MRRGWRLRAAMAMFSPAQRIVGSIKSMLPRLVTSGVVVHGEPILFVEPPNIPTVMEFLKNHSAIRAKQLTAITAVDIPSRDKRFEVALSRSSRRPARPSARALIATIRAPMRAPDLPLLALAHAARPVCLRWCTS